MGISIIFPTYQRSKDLEVALDSLLEQTLLPTETIVIDQSDDKATEELCNRNQYKKIGIKYVYSDCKSPPKAKQIGMELVSSDIDLFMFFDDDVKLMPHYLEEVDKFMKNNPKALGGGGNIINLPHKKSLVEDIGYLLFRAPFISGEFCTTDAQYKNPDKIQNVSSIIGCNMFFRKEVKDNGYKFVDRMKRYGHADDTFFTRQISRDHPDALFYLPTAKLYHYESKSGRILRIQWFRQALYHRFIFWKTYNFAMWKFYRWNIGFLSRNLMKVDNKLEIIKCFFGTHLNILKKSKIIIQNPEIINKFIYGE